MPDAPEIKVVLTAEDRGVASAIKELTSQLKNVKKQQDETASSSQRLSEAFRGIAVGVAAFKIIEFGKSVFDSATQIARASQITGASAQSLGVFHKAAGDLGISVEVVDKSFVKLSKSILSLQQGSSQSVQAFRQLGISAKDFVGLNADQKIKLVVDRLGAMAAGTNRAALAQVLLGRGGAEALPIFQSLAGDGFAKVQEEAEKMGLLFDNKTAASILAMKKQLEDLKGEAEGAATQFEVGLIPAITDAAGAMLQAINGGGANSGFKALGEEVGNLVKEVTYGLIVDGQKAAEIIAETEVAWELAMNHMKLFGKSTWEAIKGYARGGTVGAVVAASATLSADPAGRDAALQIAAIEKQFEDAKSKANLDVFGGGTGSAPPKPPAGDEGAGGKPPLYEAAGKAQLALAEKMAQDRAEIARASAAQIAQAEKESYDAGLLSLGQYFDNRRAEVLKASRDEIAAIRVGLNAAKSAAATSAAARDKAATGGNTEEADKLDAQHLSALKEVDALETKISVLQIESGTKIHALNDEQFKAQNENQLKVLEFHKLIDTTQGNVLEAAKKEIAIEQQKLQVILAQSGASKAQIDQELARYAAVKTAEVTFNEEKKDGASALKLLEDRKAGIEDKVLNGKLFQAQADQQILDLYRQQLPALQQLADQMTANAKTDDEVAQAADFQKKVAAFTTQTNTVGQQMKTFRAGIQDALTTGLSGTFDMLFQGTQNVGLAFRNLASSVVSSIAKIIAQMYIQLLVTKLLKAAGGFSGGGAVGGGMNTFGAAEGGLISGPGGPKSDSIPARLSHGEFVMKADAVAAIGVGTLNAMNRGINVPAFARSESYHFSEGGLVGTLAGAGGGDSNINLGISLDEGLVLKHLGSKAARNIILEHLTNNPKAAGKALSRSG
jgi:hypothetical protein